MRVIDSHAEGEPTRVIVVGIAGAQLDAENPAQTLNLDEALVMGDNGECWLAAGQGDEPPNAAPRLCHRQCLKLPNLIAVGGRINPSLRKAMPRVRHAVFAATSAGSYPGGNPLAYLRRYEKTVSHYK